MHGRVWRVVLLFGLIALCSAYGEGAIGDWGALHLREDLGAGAGLAAAGYAAFALAEASGRLAGSWLLATPRADPGAGARGAHRVRGHARRARWRQRSPSP